MGSMTNETIDRLADRLLAPQGAEEIPIILCRRHTPHQLTYLLWDASWEGLKKTKRGGKVYFEIDRNFNLRIELDGMCAIPDTPNNRKKLELVSQESVNMHTHDPVSGHPYPSPVREVVPPLYTRVDKTMFEKSLIDRITAQVMEKMNMKPGDEEFRHAEEPDRRPQGGRTEPRTLLNDEVENPTSLSGPKAGRKPKGGTKGKTDPLLDPIS